MAIPTPMSKVIPVNLDFKNSSISNWKPFNTGMGFWTNDIGTAFLEFSTELDLTGTVASIVLENQYDKSLVQKTITEITSSPFYYQLGYEIQHEGRWFVQISVKKGEETIVSNSFAFMVNASIGHGKVARLVSIETFETLATQLTALQTDISNYLETAETNEAIRVSTYDEIVLAEETRKEAEDIREANDISRGDTATADNTRANTDHSTAVLDHSTALTDHSTSTTDHTTALADHSIASSDHSTAVTDHTRANTDHITALADHTSYEGLLTDGVLATNIENKLLYLETTYKPELNSVKQQLAETRYKKFYVEGYVQDPMDATVGLQNLLIDVQNNNGGTIIFEPGVSYQINDFLSCPLADNGFVEIKGNNATIKVIAELTSNTKGIFFIGSDTAINTKIVVMNLNGDAIGISQKWGLDTEISYGGFLHLRATNVTVDNGLFQNLFACQMLSIEYATIISVKNIVGLNVGGGRNGSLTTGDTIGDGIYMRYLGYKKGSTEYVDVFMDIENCKIKAHDTVEVASVSDDIPLDASHSSRCGIVLEYTEGQKNKYLNIKNCEFYNFQRSIHAENIANVSLSITNSHFEDFAQAITYTEFLITPAPAIIGAIFNNCRFIRNKNIRKFTYGYSSVVNGSYYSLEFDNCYFELLRMPVFLSYTNYSDMFDYVKVNNCRFKLDSTQDAGFLGRFIGQRTKAKLEKCFIELKGNVNIDYALVHFFNCELVGDSSQTNSISYVTFVGDILGKSTLTLSGNKINKVNINLPTKVDGTSYQNTGAYQCVVTKNHFINSVLGLSSVELALFTENICDNLAKTSYTNFFGNTSSGTQFSKVQNIANNKFYNYFILLYGKSDNLKNIAKIRNNEFLFDIVTATSWNVISIKYINSIISNNIIYYDDVVATAPPSVWIKETNRINNVGNYVVKLSNSQNTLLT